MQITSMRDVFITLASIYSGSVIVNGTRYPNVEKAMSALNDYEGEVHIVLNSKEEFDVQKNIENSTKIPIYKIKVRQYMTKPASPSFDFMDKWNNGVPMPMRIMVGTVEKETKGMVKMNLHGEILEEQTEVCMKCGRILTNPVSRYFGIGPECGGHNYINPFNTKEELQKAIKEVNEELKRVTWNGWIIKSAIEMKEEVR